MSYPIAVQAGNAAPSESLNLGEFVADIEDALGWVLGAFSLKRPKAKPLSIAARMKLARSSFDARVLDALASDPESLVRNELLSNPRLPEYILVSLAGDRDKYIASQAAALL